MEAPESTLTSARASRYHARMNILSRFAFFLVLVACLVLTACGNKGPLVQAPVPQDAQIVPAPSAQQALEPVDASAAPTSNLPAPQDASQQEQPQSTPIQDDTSTNP